MKNLAVLLAVAIMTISVQAQTTGYVECEGLFKSIPQGKTQNNYNQTGLLLSCYVSKTDSNETIGWYAWSLTNKDGWAETYAGLTFSPASWVSLSAGAGLENAEKPWRVNVNAYLSYKKISLLSVVEHGGSGFWYSNELTFDVKNQLGQGQGGLVARRFYGVGALVRMTIPYTKNIVITGAIFPYDPELKGSLKASIALRYTF
jgi:hypothetical protein